jgi:hypothetical protein
MHRGHFNLRMCDCPHASNIFVDLTSEYSKVNIWSKIAQSVDGRLIYGRPRVRFPAVAHFSLSNFIHLLLLKLLLETQRM